MKTFLLVAALFALQPGASAETEQRFDYSPFGTEIELRTAPNSEKLAFGVIFSYGDDPDGNSWLINLISKTDFEEQSAWNLFSKDSAQYLFPKWRTVKKGPAFQASLPEKEAITVLGTQTDWVMVFKTKDDVLSYLRIGEMCEDKRFQDYFKNLTDSKACHEITPDDL